MRVPGSRAAQHQLGFLWGGVALLLVALSPAAPRLAQAVPACPLKSLSGLPCLTCGTTRAAVALAQGDLAAALALNPLAAAAWLTLVGGGLVAGIAALAGRPLRQPDWAFPLWARLGLVAMLAANWVYLFWAGT